MLNEIIKMQYKTECAEVIYLDKNISEEDMVLYKCSNVLVHPYRAGACMASQKQWLVIVYLLYLVEDQQMILSDDIGIKIPTKTESIDITSPSYLLQNQEILCL